VADAGRIMKPKVLSWESTPSAATDAGRNMKTVNAFMRNLGLQLGHKKLTN